MLMLSATILTGLTTVVVKKDLMATAKTALVTMKSVYMWIFSALHGKESKLEISLSVLFILFIEI